MGEKLKLPDQHLFTRRCVACGYDGDLLRNGRAIRCARCGCDFSSRPARSYAEMEGLIGHAMPVRTDLPIETESIIEPRLVHRWVVFGLVALAALTALIWLWGAAIS